MRKKLDTRFPAARIKKIMQADEDVGKIALAVPVLVSKALELFLQDLCDRTYEITLQRGAKTMSALHLKHCVQSYNVFDFLREVVSRVPDYGQAHPDAASEDRKKRKPTVEENNDSDEEFRKSKMQEMSHGSSSGRGRGRGRGQGRGRSSRNAGRDTIQHEVESDPCTSLQHSKNELNQNIDNDCGSKQVAKETILPSEASDAAPSSIDLNSDLNMNEDSKNTTTEPPAPAPEPIEEPEHEEYPGWSLSGVDKVTIDPLQLAQLGKRLDEDDEDYDEEE